MNTKEIIPFKQKIDLSLMLPGSKSITNRAFLCAALAKGKSRIYDALDSDDSQVMLKALNQFGVLIQKKENYIEIDSSSFFKKGDLTIDLHNAGTATRFLTAISILQEGKTVITGNQRMQERPIDDLVDGLRQLGSQIRYLKSKSCPPLEVDYFEELDGKGEYEISIHGNKSSQYFSALLMLAPMLKKPLNIHVIGDLVSKPYIDTTIAVMRSFSVEVENHHYQLFKVNPASYKACEYFVEGDASSASYFTALQFLHGGNLDFKNLDLSRSIQGDAHFSSALQELKTPFPRTIDMRSMPDAAMTLVTTAVFFEGETTITGLSTLRIKETDRLLALKNELTKLDLQVSITEDSLTLQGRKDWPLDKKRKAISISTYNDHRMAMCFAVLATKISGIFIENPQCTEKTYPEFWKDLTKAYAFSLDLSDKNLLLTGMRASGKSYYGKLIAKKLNRDFVDLDEVIQEEEGMSIAEIVKKKGWDYFRNVEQKICSQFSDFRNLVIASGGGVVLKEENMQFLKKNAINLFIFNDFSILSERLLSDESRPSLTYKSVSNELLGIWEERRHLYLKYADVVWDDSYEGLLNMF